MDIERYLERIRFRGRVRPTIDVLRNLQRQHMLTVPFENLDIHLGKPIVLDNPLFYRKIVEEKRGGYCYELNGCFSWLLKRIGFKVSILSARVANKKGVLTPEFDHLTLLVSSEERFLVDVGFGDSFTTPKPIDSKDSEFDHGFLLQDRRIEKYANTIKTEQFRQCKQCVADTIRFLSSTAKTIGICRKEPLSTNLSQIALYSAAPDFKADTYWTNNSDRYKADHDSKP